MKSLIRLGMAVAVLALLAPAIALAHGGGTPQLVDVPAGPYSIYTWTNPNPAEVGTMHVTVALVEPDSNEPVLNADVQVQITPAGTEPQNGAITARATHQQATIKTYYEADLEIPATGPWQVMVSYDTPQGAGNAGFDVDVQPKSFTNWFMLGGAALVVVVVGWFVWPRKRTAASENSRD